MKKFLLLIIVAVIGFFNLNAQNMNKKTLVAYFSATGKSLPHRNISMN